MQVPLGAWLSAAALDLWPGQQRAARILVGTGLAAAGPAAVTGWTDWAELPPEQARTGIVHAVANTTGVLLYAGSFLARTRGRVRAGKALGWAGLAAVGAGGALGGHLAYRQAAGANHAEAVTHLVGEGWHPVGRLSDFPVDRAVRAAVDGVDVVVVRESGGAVRVLAERCSHMAGPLSEGELTDGCVRCPWHGSLFRLSDGWNVEGPATAPSLRSTRAPPPTEASKPGCAASTIDARSRIRAGPAVVHDRGMSDRIIAACDGAAKGNPGPAAWAWVIADTQGRPERWEAGPWAGPPTTWANSRPCSGCWSPWRPERPSRSGWTPSTP